MKLRDSLADNNSILLQAEASTWQEAVKLSVDLLVKADVVEPRYYQAILDGVAQHGPYFVIAPGLAMPHGRPEEGVKKTGFALVTLKTPLVFNHEDNDPVDILITMAAVDANTHQEVGIMFLACRPSILMAAIAFALSNSAARFPHNAQRFAPADLQIHSVERMAERTWRATIPRWTNASVSEGKIRCCRALKKTSPLPSSRASIR